MRMNMLTIVSVIFCCSLGVDGSNAFSISPGATTRSHQRVASPQTTVLSMTRGGGDNPFEGGELVTALAKIDKEWQLAQSDRKKPNSRWTKLVLEKEEKEETEQSPNVALPVEEDFVYLLEPSSSIPSCIIVFLGGAGLGNTPSASAVF